MTKKTIFIASGGTGGHIIPARCLALELVNQGFRVIFLGDKKCKSYIKKEDKFLSKIVKSSKLEKSIFKLFLAVFAIIFGIFQSLFLLARFRPKYIVAFGGYATFPILIAGVIFRVKIILHEQNSHLGKVNRIFAKYSYKIATSFKETSGIEADLAKKVIFTGNLVRQEIIKLNAQPYILPKFQEEGKEDVKKQKKDERKMGYNVLLASDFYKKEDKKEEPKLFNILIIGGSGGAKIFSEILPKAFFNLNENFKEKINITQQCRLEMIDFTFEQYRAFNMNALVDNFFEDMPRLIKDAHLIIARAGSSSIFEFLAAKKPMILIPFALAADNHQEKNAQYLQENGAAIVIKEKDFKINKVNEILKKVINNKDKLELMSQNASKLATLNATKDVAKLII